MRSLTHFLSLPLGPYQHRLALFIDAMDGKHVLGKINSQSDNLHRLPLSRLLDGLQHSHLGTSMPCGFTPAFSGRGSPFHSLGVAGRTHMLFGRLVQFTTSQSRETTASRLSAAVMPATAIATLNPVRVTEWVSQHQGKRFVGTFDGSRFKLGLLQMPAARFQVRSNVVVIVGSIEDHSFRACLRLPHFILGFLAVFAVAVSAGLVLSFFGPANLATVQVAIAVSLVLPIAIVAWFFRREATEAERALRQTVLVA